ncbi:hypothetical protein HOG21_00095 [bacterium]|nr:hypothetical protein [bacterium]
MSLVDVILAAYTIQIRLTANIQEANTDFPVNLTRLFRSFFIVIIVSFIIDYE